MEIFCIIGLNWSIKGFYLAYKDEREKTQIFSVHDRLLVGGKAFVDIGDLPISISSNDNQ